MAGGWKVFLLILTVFSSEIFQIICGEASSGCVERPLVGNNSLHLPDSSYSASSYYNDSDDQDKRYAPHSAKVYGPYGWVSHNTSNCSGYLELDLLTVRVITAVVTQGSGKLATPGWVTKYKLVFKNDTNSTATWNIELSNSCDNQSKNESSVCNDCEYNGTQLTSNTTVRHDLKTPQAARFIRFVPVSYHRYKTMRINVLFVNQGSPNVTVTPYDRSIFVQWTFHKCPKLTTFITGYLLDVNPKGEFKVGPGIISKNITGLQPCTEYTVRVKTLPYGLWSKNKTIRTVDVAGEVASAGALPTSSASQSGTVSTVIEQAASAGALPTLSASQLGTVKGASFGVIFLICIVIIIS